MKKKIWKKIAYLARRSVFVRIPVIAWVTICLFVRNITRLFLNQFDAKTARKRLAFVCILSLVFGTAFGPMKGLKAEDEIPDAPAAEEAAAPAAEEPAPEPEAPVEETAPAEPVEETVPEATEPASEEPGIAEETPVDEENTTEAAEETEEPKEADETETEEETKTEEEEKPSTESAEEAAAILVMEIRDAQGTPYEYIPEEPAEGIEDGLPKEAKPHYNKVLAITNIGNAPAFALHLESPVVFFANGDEPAVSVLTLQDPLYAGTELCLGLIRTDCAALMIETADNLASDPLYTGADPYEDIKIELSSDQGMLQIMPLLPAEVLEIFDQTMVYGAQLPAAENETETHEEPEPETEEETETETETETENETETEIETETEEETEIETETEEEEEEKDRDIISVTLPTTFNIPMYQVGNGLEVVSDDVVVKNLSDFPVDVDITGVNVDIDQSVEDDVYIATLGTDADYIYDLNEIAATTNLALYVLESGGWTSSFPLAEGENPDLTSFRLSENNEAAAEAGENQATIKVRGKIMDGIFFPGMNCDLRVLVTFDFRKHMDEVSQQDEE